MMLLRSLFPSWWPGKEHDEIAIAELMEEPTEAQIMARHEGHEYEEIELIYGSGRKRKGLYCTTCDCIHSRAIA
jgi:hypothetical protein